jgi:hypothetical protein
VSRCGDVAGTVIVGSSGQVVWLPCLRYVASCCRDMAMRSSLVVVERWCGCRVVGDNETLSCGLSQSVPFPMVGSDAEADVVGSDKAETGVVVGS